MGHGLFELGAAHEGVWSDRTSLTGTLMAGILCLVGVRVSDLKDNSAHKWFVKGSVSGENKRIAWAEVKHLWL